jgi:hypothetical protein
VAELAPGLYVQRWTPKGQAFIIDLTAIGLTDDGIAGTGRAIALNEGDWNRLDPVWRERLLDEWTRRSAEAGINELAGWLEDRVRDGR